jgi:hypothetical protein
VKALKQILAALALLGLAGFLHLNRAEVDQAPSAILRAADAARKCVEDKIIYGNLSLDCGTPVSFVDLRKLDMRSDNRAARQGTSITWLAPKN